MTTRRRSEDSESMLGPNDGRDSSEDRSPGRQTTVRLSRRAGTGGGQTRVSMNRSGNSASLSATSTRGNGTRSRRATPVARRRRRAVEYDYNDYDDDYNDDDTPTRNGRGRNARGTTTTVSLDRNQGEAVATYRRDSNGNPADLAWYDRLMPDFVLNMTAPLTGYESRLDSDVDDDEYDILERQRLKRNRRIRRRLLTLVLLATAGAVFMYTRGKVMRKVGVKVAVSNMKHRIEDGLAKSIQETMGK